MTMDELRRQIATTEWPVIIRVDGKDIEVSAKEDLMAPTAGNLICMYQHGAFEIVDVDHIATLRREKVGSRRMN